MKFILSTLLFLFIAANAFAQTVVTTTPAYPTVNDSVVVIFDASKGTAGLKGFTGDVYAHTGVITEYSSNDTDWRYVIAGWTTNVPKAKMTPLGNDLYKITIKPNPKIFYGVPSNEKILKIAFVFRSADSQKEGKDTGGKDIFVPLYESGITFVFKNPTVNNSFGDPMRSPVFVQPGNSVDISVATVAIGKKTNWLYLYVDDVLKYQTASSSSIDYKFIADDYKTGRHDVKIVSLDEWSGRDSTSFVVFKNPTVKNIPLPAGNQIGINYGSDPTKVTLALYAPQKNFIYVIGDFNDWKVDTTFFMNRYEPKPDSVIWWATINVPGVTEQAYQFLIDGNLRIYDPYTDKILDPWNDSDPELLKVYPNLKPYPSKKTENIVSVLQTGQSQYNWKSGNFNRPSKEKLVIYEMLIRDFVSTHSYKTLVDTLSYFKKLGVNAIELMPISEFEGNDSWGYNPMTYFAPDKYYGSKDDLKKFIDACHQNGIAVILDIVLNHAYGLNPMVRMYWDNASGRPAANNPWFNQQSNFQNPDAQWGYDFNHESKATQYFVDRVLNYWLTEYKMDGFRFDFTKGFGNKIKDRNSDPWGSKYDADRIRLLKRMVDKVWSYDPTAIMTFEHLAENSEETELANYGILLWGNMNSKYNEATMGYHDSGKSDLSNISYKKRGWANPNLIGYMESHDEERLMYKNLTYGNASGSYNIKELPTALSRIELASAFFFTVPGPKLMWQFGELGYDISINQGGRLGKKPLPWTDGLNYYSEPNRKKLFNVFAGLIRLKKAYPAFSSADFTLNVSGAAKKININHSSMNIAIIGNFDLAASSISPSFQNTGKWYEFFSGDSVNVADVNMQISLQAGEYKLYTSKKIPKNVIEEKPMPTEFRLEQNYPNPFNPSTVISWQLAVGSFVTLKVYDILGREVATLVNEYQQVGTYSVDFNVETRHASSLPSGVYFYRIEAGDPSGNSGQSFVQTKKMVILK